MLDKILQYKNLILAVAAALLLVGLSGYLVADRKSEPVYLSKIDRLMFDKENQSPKFVITLPDKKKAAPQPIDILPAVPESSANELPHAVDRDLTVEEILSQVPSVLTLPPKEATQKLRYITIEDSLTESKDSLLLPTISKNGAKPWIEYGKQVEVLPTFKKVAVVIKGSGFDPMALDKISQAFDSEISMSFSPYAAEVGTRILTARQNGHETYMDLLLSSKDFLKSDSGPLSMSLTISDAESIKRLEKTLSPGAPIGGVVINDGIADESNRYTLTQILAAINRRGLLVIDATHGNGIEQITIKGLPRRKADIIIENLLDRNLIREEIKKAENIALSRGQVLLVVEPKPVILKEIYDWIKTFSPQIAYEESKNQILEKPLALVPVSNLVVE